jgi:hypothetical protein
MNACLSSLAVNFFNLLNGKMKAAAKKPLAELL